MKESGEVSGISDIGCRHQTAGYHQQQQQQKKPKKQLFHAIVKNPQASHRLGLICFWLPGGGRPTFIHHRCSCTRGHGGGGANPSCLGVKTGLHPGRCTRNLSTAGNTRWFHFFPVAARRQISHVFTAGPKPEAILPPRPARQQERGDRF